MPWLLFFVGLGVLLSVVLSMAVLTWVVAARGTATNPAGQPINSPGQVLAGANPSTATPTKAQSNFTPSPWPTFTPVPSNSPLKTSAPVPTQPAWTVQLLSTKCKNSLDQANTVGDQLKSNPFKVLDESWRNAVDQASVSLKTNCGTLDSASPIPGELANVQTSMNQATSEFDQAEQLWKQGFDQRDPGKVLSAAAHLSQGTSYLNQAMSQLQAIIPK